MTAPVPAEPRIPGWITDPDVIKSIESGDTETVEAYYIRLIEDELVGLRAKYVLLLGERDSLRRYVRKLLATIRAVRLALDGCDDCPGRPDCRCADGHTDTTDCTCPPQGGDS